LVCDYRWNDLRNLSEPKNGVNKRHPLHASTHSWIGAGFLHRLWVQQPKRFDSVGSMGQSIDLSQAKRSVFRSFSEWCASAAQPCALSVLRRGKPRSTTYALLPLSLLVQQRFAVQSTLQTEKNLGCMNSAQHLELFQRQSPPIYIYH
jgi:hypothetical protein